MIPAYNAAKLIDATLASVFAQTYPRLEIVVVNDGSKDDTAAVLAAHGDKIRVVTQPNGGLASARNTGARAAQGEYVVILDADDLCTPDRVGLQVAFMEAHPEVVLASSAFSAFDETGRLADDFGKTYYSLIAETPGGSAALYPTSATETLAPAGGPPRPLTVRHGSVYERLVRGNFVHPPTVIYRRALHARAGDFDTSLKYTSDWEWFVRASRVGAFGYLEAALLDYRLSPGQMSGGKNARRSALEILGIVERIYREDPALVARDGAALRRYLAEFSRDAAETYADDHLVETLRFLGRSLRYEPIPRVDTLKLFVKALLPQALISRFRQLKSQTSG